MKIYQFGIRYNILINNCKNCIHSALFTQHNRFYSEDSILSVIDKRSKQFQIQSAVVHYLKTVRNNEVHLKCEDKEFEKGKKYLAQIIGQDLSTLSQDQIDEAIEYLLPSGLFSFKARPKFKPPSEIYPSMKQMQCDISGRPLHDMFYTRLPNYFSVMNQAVYKLEHLKYEEDKLIHNELKNVNESPEEMILVSTNWLDKNGFENIIQESISDVQYTNWITLMDKLLEHPLSYKAKEFIFRFRTNPISYQDSEELIEPSIEEGTNLKYVVSYGQKKHSFAEAKVYFPGFGNTLINDKRLLEVFPDLGNREQIMFPLQLTKTIGKVDIVAKVSGPGTSSMANALRLAISRCLASLLPIEERKKLHVSGLLVQDKRFSEKKQSGQKKARKKPIWKAR